MRNSSMNPLKYGSDTYCERPIQFWLVLPSRNGAAVIALLLPTATPFTYKTPTEPASVTATCVHTPVGNAAVPVIVCSPTPLLVVIAKRTTPALLFGDRNR